VRKKEGQSRPEERPCPELFVNPFSYYFRSLLSRDLFSRRPTILTNKKASIAKPNMPQVALPLVLVAPDAGPLLSPVESPAVPYVKGVYVPCNAAQNRLVFRRTGFEELGAPWL